MCDSKGNGAINDLISEVQGGDTIIWKLDNLSELIPDIEHITKIEYKSGDKEIFDNGVTQYYKGFKLLTSENNSGRELKAKYVIECQLSDNTFVAIDPYIRIPPPPNP